MTLLQLNVNSNVGSTGRIAEQIGHVAIASGWKTYIASGRSIKESVSEVIKVGNRFAVYEHYAENRLFDNEGLASRLATKHLVQQIKELKPDIIQLHNIHDHWLNYNILFEYLNSIDTPIVWTFHDCWAFTGHCYHFESIGCEHWKSRCHDCPQCNKLGVDRSQRNYEMKRRLFTANKNLHVVTVSHWLGEMAQQSFFKNKDIRVIHNGVDINVFKPLSEQHHNNFNILGVATAWSNGKGLEDYIKLSEMLAEDCQITLVGLKTKQIQQLPSNIIGLPRTNSQQELAKLYNNADVVLSLSKAETFGLTIAEGMACGTPGIVYNNTAQPELISNDTGLLVNNGDLKAVCNAIEGIKKNGKAYYSEACRKRTVERFDKEKCFEKYIDLYESLLR